MLPEINSIETKLELGGDPRRTIDSWLGGSEIAWLVGRWTAEQARVIIAEMRQRGWTRIRARKVIVFS